MQRWQAGVRGTVVLAALAALASVPARAGSVHGGTALTHKRCAAAVCMVEVRYGAAATAGNKCGVVVPDVVIVGRGVDSVQWTLKAASGTPPLHRFTAERVKVDDNNGRSNEPGVPDIAASVFDDQPFDAAVDRKRLNALGRGVIKAFTYTIQLERQAGSGWERCDPYDPIIINKG